MADVFAVFGMCTVIAAFILIYSFYRRDQRASQAAARNPQHDLVNTMILFQSMRDMVYQQKELAREFNQNLEKRIAYVKKLVDTALREMEKLHEAQRALALRLNEARTDLESVQRQVGYLRPAPLAPPRLSPEPPVSTATPEPEDAALRVVAEPEESGAAEEIPAQWIGFDFGSEEPEPEPEPGPEPELEPLTVQRGVPRAPEDPDAARRAFRALLNMESRRTPGDGRKAAAEPSASERGNGANRMTPTEARVCEYSAAGMSLSDIARELGIGKGEVRLILSLNKERNP